MRLLAITTLAWAIAAASALINSDATEPDNTATDNVIHVQLSGSLQTARYEDGPRHQHRLSFATVQAGGTHVQLDPAGCPKITAEFINYHNEQGGGLVGDTRADVEGEMVFIPLSQTALWKAGGPFAPKLPPDTAVPVVRIRTLKITTLPAEARSSRVNRDRDLVRSTTIGLTTR